MYIQTHKTVNLISLTRAGLDYQIIQIPYLIDD